MVSRLPPASGSRWMSAATGDWPGWLLVKVARRPEHQVWGERERENQEGGLGCLPRASEVGAGEGTLLSLQRGPGLLWFPGHRRGFGVGLAWVRVITTETSCVTAELWEVQREDSTFSAGRVSNTQHRSWGDTGGPWVGGAARAQGAGAWAKS